mmetsp:Transcript_843/g.2038  ORF Transcript_843/g.2038 Transcript_843/m.2038 type:complete len:514 (-) Transcript_843:68-1609(-)
MIVMLVFFFSTTTKAFPFRQYVSKQQQRAAAATTTLFNNNNNNNRDDSFLASFDPVVSAYKKPAIQWYPGHIAKAERALSETLKLVDVVLEVRDARVCKATSHPKVGEWCAGRPRLVVMTHVDSVPVLSMKSWKRAYKQLGFVAQWDDRVDAQVRNQAKQHSKKQNNNKKKFSSSSRDDSHVVSPVENVLFVNAQTGGTGIRALHRAILDAGEHVQERRRNRGLKERPLRVGVLGYPNVGKSALINKILGRKRAKTADTPGITRALEWKRVRTNEDLSSSRTNKKKEFEILDSPGIIPNRVANQRDAFLLAACNLIGDASYDNQRVAAFLCERIRQLHQMGRGHMSAPDYASKCKERYGFDPFENDYAMTGEDVLYKVADKTCHGCPEDAGRKILQDFRNLRLGKICLQLAPTKRNDPGEEEVRLVEENLKQSREEWHQNQRLARAQAAMETAKERGLELPPAMMEKKKTKTTTTTGDMDMEDDLGQDDDNDVGQLTTTIAEDQIGKGLFDGW